MQGRAPCRASSNGRTFSLSGKIRGNSAVNINIKVKVKVRARVKVRIGARAGSFSASRGNLRVDTPVDTRAGIALLRQHGPMPLRLKGLPPLPAISATG